MWFWVLPNNTVFRLDMKLKREKIKLKYLIKNFLVFISKSELVIKEVTLYFNGKLSC